MLDKLRDSRKSDIDRVLEDIQNGAFDPEVSFFPWSEDEFVEGVFEREDEVSEDFSLVELDIFEDLVGERFERREDGAKFGKADETSKADWRVEQNDV